MSLLSIELANAITRDREREFQDRARFGNTRPRKSRRRVLPHLRWFPNHRVRRAVFHT
jgi:hypothetical protein